YNTALTIELVHSECWAAAAVNWVETATVPLLHHAGAVLYVTGGIKPYRGAFHNIARMIRSASALSASSLAISSRISLGLRCFTSPLPFGFLTERSKVSGSIFLASTIQDLGESANLAWSSMNSFRSSSLRGLVLPRLRPGSSW